MELSPANVAWDFSVCRPFSALEIATLKGGGGVRKGKDRGSVLKTLWKRFFEMVSFRIISKNYEKKTICFAQRPLQSAVYI